MRDTGCGYTQLPSGFSQRYAIIRYSIARKKMAHECGEADIAAAKQNMRVIGHQCPCIDGCVSIKGDFTHPVYKIFRVIFVVNNSVFFNTPEELHDAMFRAHLSLLLWAFFLPCGLLNQTMSNLILHSAFPIPCIFISIFSASPIFKAHPLCSQT